MALAASGSVPARNVSRPMIWNSGSHRCDRLVRAAGDDSELPGRGEVGPAEHRRRHQHLPGRGVGGGEGANRPDAVGAHRQVDGPGRQRIAQTTLAEDHVVNRRVFRQHRDHHLAPGAQFGERRRRRGRPRPPPRRCSGA